MSPDFTRNPTRNPKFPLFWTFESLDLTKVKIDIIQSILGLESEGTNCHWSQQPWLIMSPEFHQEPSQKVQNANFSNFQWTFKKLH